MAGQQPIPFASPARTRRVIANACWRRRKPCSAPAAPTPAWKRWRKRAGVGIGTLYRHFPTREALFEAVYRREVEQLSELAEQLKSAASPVDALRRWLKSNVEFVATKKGMITALALVVQGSSELYAYSFDRLTKAVGSLLDRAVAAGEIRADISPEDVLRALIGMCYMHEQPGWQSTVLRLMDVFIDGLRVPPDAGRNATPSTKRAVIKKAKTKR